MLLVLSPYFLVEYVPGYDLMSSLYKETNHKLEWVQFFEDNEEDEELYYSVNIFNNNEDRESFENLFKDSIKSEGYIEGDEEFFYDHFYKIDDEFKRRDVGYFEFGNLMAIYIERKTPKVLQGSAEFYNLVLIQQNKLFQEGQPAQ